MNALGNCVKLGTGISRIRSARDLIFGRSLPAFSELIAGPIFVCRFRSSLRLVARDASREGTRKVVVSD
jgi:hypothetical protein